MSIYRASEGEACAAAFFKSTVFCIPTHSDTSFVIISTVTPSNCISISLWLYDTCADVVVLFVLCPESTAVNVRIWWMFKNVPSY